MTRSPLWREFESGEGVLLWLLRACVLGGGMIFLLFTGTISLTWPQQLIVALLAIFIALWLDRSSTSYLVTLTLMLLSIYSTFRYGFWRVSTTISFFRDPGTQWNALDMFFICMLLLAECYAFVVLFLGYLQMVWPLRRTPVPLPDEIEDAVVQVMTYLIENETAALIVPGRFLARLHPHFREVMQLLAVQAADEARHIEVFTRRALLHRGDLGLSTAGGRSSLDTLLSEPDFALASFLLSVLGEGSFLSLLWFLHAHAPDPVTAEVARLAAQDEARHVAFGLAHLARHVDLDPTLRPRLAAAVERRHDALRASAGLNEEVFDALVLLAAGAWTEDALARGWDAVAALEREMDQGRQRRLRKLGFDARDAEALSALHTKNFM